MKRPVPPEASKPDILNSENILLQILMPLLGFVWGCAAAAAIYFAIENVIIHLQRLK